MSERIAAVKCLRRECARMTLHSAQEPAPVFCPYCAAAVQSVPLAHRTQTWERR